VNPVAVDVALVVAAPLIVAALLNANDIVKVIDARPTIRCMLTQSFTVEIPRGQCFPGLPAFGMSTRRTGLGRNAPARSSSRICCRRVPTDVNEVRDGSGAWTRCSVRSPATLERPFSTA
jgi:hypothetical protein